jgi:hypothetical protein
MNSDCSHVTTEVRRRVKSNGAVVVCRQCVDCGTSLGELPKHQFVVESLPEYDYTLNERWRTEYNQRFRDIADVEQAKRTEEWWTAYNAYLQTPHWRKIRKIVLQRDPTCTACLEYPSEQAHHLSYESYNKHGFSFAHECVGVCVDCHRRLS